jgi:diacylglycerol kinase family enzyme
LPAETRLVYFIENPHAGRGKRFSKSESLLRMMVENGFDVYKAASAEEIIHGQGFDLVVVCGGDGILHREVQAIFACRIPVTILPTKLLNMTFRIHSLPSSAPGPFRAIVDGCCGPIPAGRVDENWFLSEASFGFKAEVGQPMQGGSKYRWDLLSYTLPLLKPWWRLRSRTLTSGMRAVGKL